MKRQEYLVTYRQSLTPTELSQVQTLRNPVRIEEVTPAGWTRRVPGRGKP